MNFLSCEGCSFKNPCELFLFTKSDGPAHQPVIMSNTWCTGFEWLYGYVLVFRTDSVGFGIRYTQKGLKGSGRSERSHQDLFAEHASHPIRRAGDDRLFSRWAERVGFAHVARDPGGRRRAGGPLGPGLRWACLVKTERWPAWHHMSFPEANMEVEKACP